MCDPLRSGAVPSMPDDMPWWWHDPATLYNLTCDLLDELFVRAERFDRHDLAGCLHLARLCLNHCPWRRSRILTIRSDLGWRHAMRSVELMLDRLAELAPDPEVQDAIAGARDRLDGCWERTIAEDLVGEGGRILW